MFAIHLVNSSAGFVAHLAEFAFSASAHAEGTVGAGVGIIDAVDHGVGFLGGFDGLVAGEAAALVHAVGDHDDHFTADFAFKLLVGREVNGVVEDGAAGA